MIDLAQFTESGLLVPRLAGDQRENVINELCRRLEETGRVENAGAFARAVMEHEELAPAVFDGVAFLLAHKGAVKELSFAVGCAAQPIHWRSSPGALVNTVVLFAVPSAAERSYATLVLAFSSLLNEQEKFATLHACARPEEMLDVLAHFQPEASRNKLN